MEGFIPQGLENNQMKSNQHGGRRPGAGRKPGAATIRTREIANQAIAVGQSPLEYLLNVMRDSTNPLEVRMEAAKICCPFVHPRLQAIQLDTREEKDTPIIEVVYVNPPPKRSEPRYQKPSTGLCSEGGNGIPSGI